MSDREWEGSQYDVYREEQRRILEEKRGKQRPVKKQATSGYATRADERRAREKMAKLDLREQGK